jgi:hypothetical protein
MKPEKSYINLQRELQTLMEQKSQPDRRRQLEAELQSKFMAAWKLQPDRLRLSERLAGVIKCLPSKTGGTINDIEHCSYYTGANDQRVIVTQPYAIIDNGLRRDLWSNEKMVPEIIVATEWAFYYPGHAALIILKFPSDYKKALMKFKDAQARRGLS